MERLMPLLAPARLAQNLHETNLRLSSLFDSLTPGAANQPGPVATPQQMRGLLSELMRAGAWLRTLPEEKDSELEAELTQYRQIVGRLRTFLPSIQSGLLLERSRLEQERSRLQGAAEWAGRSRQIL